MAKALTAKRVEQIKPTAKRREISDGGSGLYLQVMPSGVRSWCFRYRYDGKPRKLTLGKYPLYGLIEARQAARQAREALDEGRDPAAERLAAKKARPSEADLFKNVADEFLTRYARVYTRQSSSRETERLLTREVLPTWGERSIHSITKRDVLDLLDGIVDRDAGYVANRCLAVVRRLFSWALERDIIALSPCAGVKPPSAERSRDRMLSNSEVRLLWKACDDIGHPFGGMFKLLLLTGQRRNEVAGMTNGELDLASRTWSIPGERTKNGKAHIVHLSAPALAVIKSLPRIKSKAGYLFTTNGETYVSGFSRAKAILDRLMLAETRKSDPAAKIEAWRLHDLRRTCASGMARLGVPVHVVEAALNHRSGSVSGVAAVYNRYDYLRERQEALDAWGQHVLALAGKVSVPAKPHRQKRREEHATAA